VLLMVALVHPAHVMQHTIALVLLLLVLLLAWQQQLLLYLPFLHELDNTSRNSDLLLLLLLPIKHVSGCLICIQKRASACCTVAAAANDNASIVC
jgi:hypothetical protein